MNDFGHFARRGKTTAPASDLQPAHKRPPGWRPRRSSIESYQPCGCAPECSGCRRL
ncbi:MAG: hypothetical protein MZV63_28765 [Marinilabiliales bacterium]|nr:hypothetical protein [Marinilabiliales bacterium]